MRFKPSFYRALPGSKSYIYFLPHVTIVTFQTSNVPSLETLIPSHARATPARFKELRIGDNYLGSLSVTVHQDRELIDLRDSIADHLEDEHHITTNSRRFPHFSLFYVDQTFPGERWHLCNELLLKGLVQNNPQSDSIILYSPGDGRHTEFRAMDRFLGREIWLMDCNGPVKSWRHMGTCILPDRGSSSRSRPARLSFLGPADEEQPDARQEFERRVRGHASSSMPVVRVEDYRPPVAPTAPVARAEGHTSPIASTAQGSRRSATPRAGSLGRERDTVPPQQPVHGVSRPRQDMPPHPESWETPSKPATSSCSFVVQPVSTIAIGTPSQNIPVRGTPRNDTEASRPDVYVGRSGGVIPVLPEHFREVWRKKVRPDVKD